MQRRWTWVMGSVAGLAVAAMVQAEPLPAASAREGHAAAGTPPSVEACKAKCGPLVEECLRNLGTALGDMRRHCEHAALRRCLGAGLGVCERVAEAPAAAAPRPTRQ